MAWGNSMIENILGVNHYGDFGENPLLVPTSSERPCDATVNSPKETKISTRRSLYVGSLLPIKDIWQYRELYHELYLGTQDEEKGRCGADIMSSQCATKAQILPTIWR
jgi:hypothetical protein